MDAEMISTLLNQLRQDVTEGLAGDQGDSVTTVPVARASGPFPTPTSPVIVGHASQLTNVRDFLTDQACGVSVVVARQEDGSVKGFLNVCRHRGVRVIADQTGNRRSFTCPYHGWTYGVDGCLRGIPYRQAFDDIHRAERGLREIPVELRHGLVWAIPTPASTVDVEAFLGPEMDRELSGPWLDRLRVEVVDTGGTPADAATARDLLRGALRPQGESTRVRAAAVGTHRRDIAADLTQLPGGCDAEDLLSNVVLTYELSDADIVTWQGAHAEVWSIHPAVMATQLTTVRGILLVPADAAGDSVAVARDAFEKRLAVVTAVAEAPSTVTPGSLTTTAAP